MYNRSPTYRSSVNLNHEQTLSSLDQSEYRSMRSSRNKPKDKIGAILSYVEQADWN